MAVICSIRLVRFWAERKRSFSNWKIAQIRARPITTRSEARSPWIKRRSVSLRPRLPSSARAVVAAASLIVAPPPRRSSSSPSSPTPVIAETTCSSVVCFGREVAGRPAEPEDEDAVGDLEDVDQVVADHDDAELALAQAPDQVQHLRGLGDAERRGRLVEQHDLRLAEQRAGDRDLLALAAGERPDLAAQAGDRHRQVGEQLAGLVLHPRLVELARDRARARARPPRGRGRGWRRRRGCRRGRGPGRRSRSPGRSRPGAWRSRPPRRRSGSCPSSAAWMPAIVFTSVDLPAPLSPTRPTTSPAWTAKSTRSRAWTGPNRLLTPSSSRSGAPSAHRQPEIPASLQAGRVGAGAEFGGGDEPVGDDRALDVVFGHRDRFSRIAEGTSALPLLISSVTLSCGTSSPSARAIAISAAIFGLRRRSPCRWSCTAGRRGSAAGPRRSRPDR